MSDSVDFDEFRNKDSFNLSEVSEVKINKDLVCYMADEKLKYKAAYKRRRLLWQITIFSLAVIINFLISFKDHFVIDITWQEPDSTLNLAMNLCKGIGYVIIGNLYDNVPKPKKLTSVVLLCLAVCTALVR